jgi:hypothetical protein
MMPSPYDVGFGPWSLWMATSMGLLLIWATLAWAVVALLRRRDPPGNAAPRASVKIRKGHHAESLKSHIPAASPGHDRPAHTNHLFDVP